MNTLLLKAQFCYFPCAVKYVSVKTYSVVAHCGISRLGGLARCRRGRGSLILGISALAGGRLSLRHVEGVREILWEREEGQKMLWEFVDI